MIKSKATLLICGVSAEHHEFKKRYNIGQHSRKSLLTGRTDILFIDAKAELTGEDSDVCKD